MNVLAAALLRQIPAELDHHHDRRADCYHHRADKRQLFKQAHKDRPNAESSLHMREAPACHTHRTSPFSPSSSGLIFNAKRAPAITYSGVPLIKVKEPLCKVVPWNTEADARLDNRAASRLRLRGVAFGGGA